MLRLMLTCRLPSLIMNRLDITTSRSEVFLTGRNLLRGTLTPMAPLKFFIAAPAAVSSCITLIPWEVLCVSGRGLRYMSVAPPPLPTFLLTMTSIVMSPLVTSLSMAGSFTHRLLVLNILNLEMDLNSSTYKTMIESYIAINGMVDVHLPCLWVLVLFPAAGPYPHTGLEFPPFTSDRVLLVTSMTNSQPWSCNRWFRMAVRG